MDALLASLDLEISDVDAFFNLLDYDGNGAVDIDEFTLGCMRLKGTARSLDVARLQVVMDRVLQSSAVLLYGLCGVAGILEESGELAQTLKHAQKVIAPKPQNSVAAVRPSVA